jgi:predicted phage-related endonuclease
MAADLWAERHRRKLRRMGVRFHPEIPNLLVHIDRRILHPIQGHRTPGVLEVKCPSLFEFKRIKREGIGEAYILQMQHALAVTGWSWGFFAIFSAELWELIDFQVVREEKIIAKILEEGQRFWRLVENGPPPDRFPITEARCPKCPWRTTCQGEALLGARREEEGKWDSCELPLDENIGPLVNEFLEMKGLEEEASALTETAKARLQEALGNRQAVRAPGARIYYRATETKRIDTRALKIDLPEVAAKYERTSVVRSLRVYPD